MIRKFLKITIFVLILTGSVGLTYHLAAAQEVGGRLMTEVPREFWSWKCAASGGSGGCIEDSETQNNCAALEYQFCPPCDPGTDFNFIWANACQGSGGGSGGGTYFFWEQCFYGEGAHNFNYCGYNTGAECTCIKQYSQPDPSVCEDPTAINYGGSSPCNYGTQPPPAQTYLTVSVSPAQAALYPDATSNFNITVNKGGGPVTRASVNISCNQSEALYWTTTPREWPEVTCTYPEGNIVNFGSSNSATIPYQVTAPLDMPVPRAGSFKVRANAEGSCQGTCSNSTDLILSATWGSGLSSACAAVSAPDSVVAGSQFTATVAVSNTASPAGGMVWRSGRVNSVNPIRLGSFNHNNNTTDNFTWGTNRVEATSDYIYPGQHGNYTATFTAPSTPGTYPFDWKMVAEGVQWFGPYCGKNINVVTGPTVDISATPQSIDWNSVSTLNWSYAGAESCTITPPASPSGYPSGSGSVSTGNLTTSRTYTITCNSGPVSTSKDTTVTVAPAPDLNLNLIKSGQGTVTSNPPGISCGAGCSSQSAPFEGGTPVQLVATSASNRIFTGWTGCTTSTRNPNGSGGTCDVTMNGNRTVIANFIVDPNYKEF